MPRPLLVEADIPVGRDRRGVMSAISALRKPAIIQKRTQRRLIALMRLVRKRYLLLFKFGGCAPNMLPILDRQKRATGRQFTCTQLAQVPRMRSWFVCVMVHYERSE